MFFGRHRRDQTVIPSPSIRIRACVNIFGAILTVFDARTRLDRSKII